MEETQQKQEKQMQEQKPARKTLSTVASIGINVCAIVLAATFLFSGFLKANDPIGAALKTEEWLSAMGIGFLGELTSLGIALVQTWAEFIIGMFLLTGMHRRTSGIAALVLMAGMTALTAWNWATEAVPDCGCFGEAIALTPAETFGKNLALLLPSIAIVLWPRYRRKWVGKNWTWLINTVAALGIIAFSTYSIYALPTIDFRPYRVGTDLRSLYLRPSPDRPESLTVADLCIMDTATDEDITEELLTRPDTTLLFVAPDLATADQGCTGDINLLYEEASAKGINVVFATGSDQKEMQQWTDHTGAEYPYYFADPTALRTIVRANPGLVLIINGRVAEKWSNWNMPTTIE